MNVSMTLDRKLNYHDVDGVKQREQTSRNRLDELCNLADTRKANINAAIERQQELDRKRLDFAKRAAVS